MSGSHEKLPGLFWIQLVLVAIVGALFVYYSFNPESEGHGAGVEGATHEVSEKSKQALKPIGQVAVNSEGKGASAGTARSGEEIVNKTCHTCHATGVANAPIMDETGKPSWEERVSKGLDQLVASAKAGKGAMPPKGTDPTLSDDELKNAIVYMLDKAGVDVSSASTTAESSEKPGVTTASTTQENAKPEATESATPASSQSTDKSADDTAGSASAEQDVAPAAPAAPEAPEPPTPDVVASSAEGAAAVASATATAGGEAEAAPNAEKVADTQPAIDGGKIYQGLCFACHGTGAAGAPKLDDKAAWEPRLAQGKDALYHSAINGKTSPTGVMPAKGGNMSLSDDEVKAAVDYMLSQMQ